MPEQEDPFKELKEQEQNRQQMALAVLSEFVSEYSPARDKKDADTFYSTKEIIKAIEGHTGVSLNSPDIFELMKKMGYKYEAMDGLDFNWLLKK